MSENAPTFRHKGFTPDIKKRLSRQDLEVMEDWQMSTVGVPVPTYHNAKAAIW